MSDKDLSTHVVHAGEKRVKPHHAITTPISQTSTYTFRNTQDLVDYMEAKMWGDEIEREEYGRYGNPTIATAEAKLAALDSGEAACLFSSGMAAVTTTLFTLLSQGGHVILTDDCYRRTRQFVTKFLARYGVESTQVPMGDYEALEAAIRPNTKVIVSESPTNPYLRVLDLEKIVAIAKKHNIKTVIDSTFATPINQRPLEFGVDFVVHSATKYLGGHNDLLAGVVVGSDYMIGAIKETQAMLGDVSDPHTAYLLIRGLKTLDLRVKRQNETADKLAHFLAKHPAVRRVYYPGLVSHPEYEVAIEQMSGFGGVVSFELDTDLAGAGRFIDELQIPYIGPSLGGVETLIEQVALVSYYELSTEERAEIGISDSLIRLAVGIESADDLLADLAQALDKAFQTETLFQSVNGSQHLVPVVMQRR
ncbi:MAG TPA: aminotransferase class I/II-fold pyridoxal phosphate-dependent enzyme [Anaerolineae bacterium]|nr:aminotransferase class I/II-fold pyridoxal phosphate-dependent enzyme [Anaerolineae bacterium]MCB9106804.1 aminotransferase class I/II-fold pyridoxal phosphate-dependent enzyme [Anaerolineales bacterium]HRV92259.1 aminotransferase class I/II-fold pyridoxal phosphate-dependent enzyme [Anaerolineae bacterium]